MEQWKASMDRLWYVVHQARVHGPGAGVPTAAGSLPRPRHYPLVPVSYSTDTTIMSTLTLTTINITSRYSLALTNKCVVKVKIMKVSVLANSYLN